MAFLRGFLLCLCCTFLIIVGIAIFVSIGTSGGGDDDDDDHHSQHHRHHLRPPSKPDPPFEPCFDPCPPSEIECVVNTCLIVDDENECVFIESETPECLGEPTAAPPSPFPTPPTPQPMLPVR